MPGMTEKHHYNPNSVFFSSRETKVSDPDHRGVFFKITIAVRGITTKFKKQNCFPLGFSVGVNYSNSFALGEDICEELGSLHTSAVNCQARTGKARQMEGR